MPSDAVSLPGVLVCNGDGRLATNSSPTGSAMPPTTMGTVLVACLAARAGVVLATTMTSTLSRARSVASSLNRSACQFPYRRSIDMLKPQRSPVLVGLCRIRHSRGIGRARIQQTDNRERSSLFCEPAPGGHILAPPTSVMISRRFIASPQDLGGMLAARSSMATGCSGSRRGEVPAAGRALPQAATPPPNRHRT